MRFYRPKSIRRLLLLGFIVVAVPLLAALIHAAYSVEKLVVQGQRALFATVRTTQSSQMLLEAITDMERNARQYQVLGDEALLLVYNENHEKFVSTANSLAILNLSPLQRERLERIVAIEESLYDALQTASLNAGGERDLPLETFSGLSRDARRMMVHNRELVAREVGYLETRGGRVQRRLVVQAVALIPAAMLLAAVFTFMITRPLRQMDRAIRRLGDGDFSQSAQIVGPRDLEQLGERLDWMRTRLLDVEQEKNRFLRHISHELKTPLTAIREGTELLTEEVVGNLNSQQREIVAILRGNSVQLQKLIENLLDFNIATSRATQLNVEPVALDELMESVLADHKIAALARQLEMDVSLQAVELEGDRSRLGTLLDNLISNAIKYSPVEGTLRVRVERRGEQAVVEVADSGPGIPEEERRRIFDAFYQGASSGGGHVRGTGLGLSIAREYAQAHGGYIEVIDSEDRGACLRVVLPLKLKEARRA